MERKKKSKRLEGEMKALKRVNFSLLAPEAQNVSLAGNFNGWSTQAHPLKKSTKGKWKISIDLKPDRYEYRFLVDGIWRNDPKCTTFTPNPFGGENCVLALK